MELTFIAVFSSLNQSINQWKVVNSFLTSNSCYSVTQNNDIVSSLRMQLEFLRKHSRSSNGIPPLPFYLLSFVYIFIFNKNNILSYLFIFFLVFVSIYLYNIMVTTACIAIRVQYKQYIGMKKINIRYIVYMYSLMFVHGELTYLKRTLHLNMAEKY